MELPTRIELRVGEHYELRLAGLAAAGYVWRHSIAGDQKALIVEPSVDKIRVPTTEAPSNASAVEVFTIKAVSAAHVSIHFSQSRPWEKSAKPIKEYEIDVTVKAP